MTQTHIILLLISALTSPSSWATTTDMPGDLIDFTTSGYGLLALAIFVICYIFVIAEDKTHLSKSKPVMVGAGVIWILVGLAYASTGDYQTAGDELRAAILEYAELFLFLLSAMTFVHMMEERHVFLAIRSWLIDRNFSLRRVFWLTGAITFCLSPVADNLSAALLMGSVVMTVGSKTPKFVSLGCLNVVIAANAGGVFSPFGDITSLMVWQAGHISFSEFLLLFPSALVNWLVPAVILGCYVPNGPPQTAHKRQQMKKGGLIVSGLFISTAALSVSVHSQLGLPPVLGMMTGLGVLKLYGYYLSHHDPMLHEMELRQHHADALASTRPTKGDHIQVVRRFDIFRVVERASWDTLMFFYGIVLCVGGLSTLGYLHLVSTELYGTFGMTFANLIIGLSSSLVDNIPIMYAVLAMEQTLPTYQWLLVTLAVGTGGSLLAIGSAAGVALMGQASGIYTFRSHLQWSWAILLGYLLSCALQVGIAKVLGLGV